MLTKLSLDTQLDIDFTGRRCRAKCVQIAACHTFGARIGRIVKTYDYINRVVITLPLTVYEGTWTTLSPLIAMPSP